MRSAMNADELIAAAFYVARIIYSSLGLIGPFNSKRFTSMRDVPFLTGPVIMFTWTCISDRFPDFTSFCWFRTMWLMPQWLSLMLVVRILWTWWMEPARASNNTWVISRKRLRSYAGSLYYGWLRLSPFPVVSHACGNCGRRAATAACQRSPQSACWTRWSGMRFIQHFLRSSWQYGGAPTSNGFSGRPNHTRFETSTKADQGRIKVVPLFFRRGLASEPLEILEGEKWGSYIYKCSADWSPGKPKMWGQKKIGAEKSKDHCTARAVAIGGTISSLCPWFFLCYHNDRHRNEKLQMVTFKNVK